MLRIRFFVSKVPISDSVEVNIAHVITRNGAYLLSILFDLTPDEVLQLQFISVKLYEGFEPVSFILKRLLADLLPAECTDEYVQEFIRDTGAFNFLSVVENNLLLAYDRNISAARPCIDVEGTIARENVVFVRSFN